MVRKRVALKPLRLGLVAVIASVTVLSAPGRATRGEEECRTKQLLFHRVVEGHYDIFTVRNDRDHVKRVTDFHGEDRYASWSPNHCRIAFGRYVKGDWELFVMRADGTRIRQITRNRVRDAAPEWSPDGKSLVFERGKQPDLDIFAITLANGRLKAITSGEEKDFGPVYSPSGEQIAFARGSRKSDIYLVDADGSNLQRLTRDGTAFAPDWHCDGKWIIYNAERRGNLDLFRINRSGENLRRLTRNHVDDVSPAWSPSGRRFVFQYLSSRSDSYNLRVSRSNGRGTRTIIWTKLSELAPDW